MGVDPARLGGPIIGVASTWTGTMPCNLNQRDLADRVSEGVSAAGGLALGFNTIAVSDNQSQGTPGMRASLISREVIADSIELMVHAHDFDGLVCVVGCDKTVPAALMALARVDKPAVLVYSGPMRAPDRHGRHRRNRRFDERRASPARDCLRSGRAADARGVDSRRGPDARDRKPRALGPMDGSGLPPRGRLARRDPRVGRWRAR